MVGVEFISVWYQVNNFTTYQQNYQYIYFIIRHIYGIKVQCDFIFIFICALGQCTGHVHKSIGVRQADSVGTHTKLNF